MKKLNAILSVTLAAALLCGCTNTQEPVGETAAAVASLIDPATTQAFLPDAVAEDDIQSILLAGINAPSAMNGQPWHFSVITDPDVMQQIADGMSAGMGAPPAKDGAGPSSDAVEKPADEVVEETSEEPEAVDGESEAAQPEGSGKAKPDKENKPEGEAGAALPEGQAAPAAPSGSGAAKAGMADAPLAIVISCEEGSEFDAGLACQNMSAEAMLLGYGTKIISSPTIALNGSEKEAYKELLGIPEAQTAVAVLLIGYADTSLDAVSSATARNPETDVVTYVKPQ